MKESNGRNLRQACFDLVGEDTTLVFADGYDTAILGVGDYAGETLVVYDVQAIIELLQRRAGMTEEEAEEFYEYNIAGAWMGEGMPVFLRGLGQRCFRGKWSTFAVVGKSVPRRAAVWK